MIEDITRAFNEASKRLVRNIDDHLRDGYEIWHWWDDPIEEKDEVVTFGFLTLVKRKEPCNK